jgi:hypothetical protein
MKGLSSNSWTASTLQAPSNGSVSLGAGRACHCTGLEAGGWTVALVLELVVAVLQAVIKNSSVGLLFSF